MRDPFHASKSLSKLEFVLLSGKNYGSEGRKNEAKLNARRIAGSFRANDIDTSPFLSRNF